jgi:hypothetical protein
MTQRKTIGRDDQMIRSLDDAELDAVTGGLINTGLPQPTITGTVPNTAWVFKDVFVKHGIGY